MKNLVLSLFVFLSFSTLADQLAYISKAEAEKAVEIINKSKYVYLFCGCCSLIEPKKVRVIKASYQHTGYEDYYEVYVQYEEEDASSNTIPIDLAYVWIKKFFRPKTIGKIMKLEHDYCVKPKDYNNPKYIEKDI